MARLVTQSRARTITLVSNHPFAHLYRTRFFHMHFIYLICSLRGTRNRFTCTEYSKKYRLPFQHFKKLYSTIVEVQIHMDSRKTRLICIITFIKICPYDEWLTCEKKNTKGDKKCSSSEINPAERNIERPQSRVQTAPSPRRITKYSERPPTIVLARTPSTATRKRR